MSRPDPFGFDMSVRSAKKKNPRGRKGMTGESETSQRVCDHDGCEEPGKFRAPKAPDVLDDFYWFCKDHVREYNAQWSFFEGKTEALVALGVRVSGVTIGQLVHPLVVIAATLLFGHWLPGPSQDPSRQQREPCPRGIQSFQVDALPRAGDGD